MHRVDLSADIGELSGTEGRAHDRLLLHHLTTAHIATGGHTGDVSSMRESVNACRLAGVRVGAHPSYPDREGFGRRRFHLAAEEVIESVDGQITALRMIANECGGEIESIKPHGQLYHDLSNDAELQDAFFDLMRRQSTPLVLAAGSPAATAAREAGLAVTAEGFCDRTYDAAGSLLSRDHEDALMTNPESAAQQARELVERGLMVEGTAVTIDTLCLHSDTPGAVAVAQAVHAVLKEAGVLVAAPRR